MADGKSFSHLVVIGSSAGGIDALSTLVATLPADFPAPLVLAQHLDPTRPSHLAEILARRSTLPVRTVVDPEPLEAGVVFVVPSNHYVSIDDHMIELQVEGAGRPKPSIDRLLGTAAEGYGERLIAVILTGMGSDGAAGARAVNQAGGTVIIQNPATASFPAMPQSLAPTTVDIVADLERIGPILHDLVRGGLANGGDAPAREDEERELGDFLAQLRERNGVDFSSYKEPTIRRRLQRRIVAVGAQDLRGYRAYLDAHPEEYQQLIASFLIKVTAFFRDPELFAYLRETILPDLIAQADRRGPSCASGRPAARPARRPTRWRSWSARSWADGCRSTPCGSSPPTSTRRRSPSPAAASTPPRPWTGCPRTWSPAISPRTTASTRCARRCAPWSSSASTTSASAPPSRESTWCSAATC